MAAPREPRWPAVLNTLAIAALFYSLPLRYSTPGPAWLLPSLAISLLSAAVVAHYIGRLRLNFYLGVVLLIILTVAEIWSLILLVSGLPAKREGPGILLQSAASLWIANWLLFASWYWRLDAGGTHRRYLRDKHAEGAFLFPQLTLEPGSPMAQAKWRPGFVDYLFLAFNTSTAFSPTDTPVLSPWAKLASMCQASISLGVIALLVARGISLL